MRKTSTRPSTTPLRSRNNEWTNPSTYGQKSAKPGLPEVRLRKEPRLGALGTKKKILFKKSSGSMQKSDSNFE